MCISIPRECGVGLEGWGEGGRRGEEGPGGIIIVNTEGPGSGQHS